MRVLAHREPTLAQHVHVGVRDQAGAVRALDGLRGALPLLLAVSANSPFWRGGDSGFASIRTPIFGMFPRTGIQRRFGHYAEYMRTVDQLLRTEVIPDPRLPVVGRAAAASARDGRGADHGRPDARGGRRRAGRARPVPRRRFAEIPATAPPRPRCSTRTASWPPATAWRPRWSTRARSGGDRRATCWPSSGGVRAGRGGTGLRAPSWRPSPRSPPIPVYARQRRVAAEHGLAAVPEWLGGRVRRRRDARGPA